MKKNYVLAIAAIIFAASISAATVFVSPSGLASNGGDSWSSSKDLLSGIAAATASDEIWVKCGTYPINAVVTLVGKKIYGGFEGTETAKSQRAKTDIDGNGITEPWEFSNLSIVDGQKLYPVFSVSGKWAVVDGLVFQNGFFNASTAVNTGTGLNVSGAASDTINVSNCIIRSNKTTAVGNAGVSLGDGAAGVCATGPNITIESCLIEKDSLDLSTNTTFTASMLTNGAGIEIVNSCLKNSVVRNNISITKVSATAINNFVRGGGVFAKYSANNNTPLLTPRVINCVIANNEIRSYGQRSGLSGAGMYLYDAGYIENCTVVNNKFTTYLNADGTGGIYNTGDGAGIYTRMGSTATAMYPNRCIYNTVVWGNTTSATANIAVTPNEFKNQIYIKETSNWSTFDFKNVVTTENYYGANTLTLVTASLIASHTASNCILTCSKDNTVVKFNSPSSLVGVGTDAEVKANWSINEGSYLIGLGAPISGLITDFNGITYKATPAVGAFEFGTPSAVNRIETSTMYRSGNILYGTEFGDKVMAYSLTGIMVMNEISINTQITIPAKGYYILKVVKHNGKTIIVK